MVFFELFILLFKIIIITVISIVIIVIMPINCHILFLFPFINLLVLTHLPNVFLLLTYRLL